LVLEDQIPLTNQKDITIDFDVKNADGADYNATTGMLKWKLNIKPGETVKVKYTYTVKHPKDMNLQVW
jgi:cytochrome c oxidase assembly protein Cox11